VGCRESEDREDDVEAFRGERAGRGRPGDVPHERARAMRQPFAEQSLAHELDGARRQVTRKASGGAVGVQKRQQRVAGAAADLQDQELASAAPRLEQLRELVVEVSPVLVVARVRRVVHVPAVRGSRRAFGGHRSRRGRLRRDEPFGRQPVGLLPNHVVPGVVLEHGLRAGCLWQVPLPLPRR